LRVSGGVVECHLIEGKRVRRFTVPSADALKSEHVYLAADKTQKPAPSTRKERADCNRVMPALHAVFQHNERRLRIAAVHWNYGGAVHGLAIKTDDEPKRLFVFKESDVDAFRYLGAFCHQ